MLSMTKACPYIHVDLSISYDKSYSLKALGKLSGFRSLFDLSAVPLVSLAGFGLYELYEFCNAEFCQLIICNYVMFCRVGKTCVF
jgi:hypothetical protein